MKRFLENRPRRRCKVFWGTAVAGLCFLVVAGVFFRQQLSWAVSGSEPQIPGMLPSETEMLFVFKPDLNQMFNFNNIKQKYMSITQFNKAINDFKASIKKESGIDFDKDVIPWLGYEMAVAAWDLDNLMTEEEDYDDYTAVSAGSADSEPSGVFIATVKNKAKLNAFWVKLSQKAKKEEIPYEVKGYRGVSLLVNWDGTTLTSFNNVFVIGTGERCVCQLIDQAKNSSAVSLADTACYRKIAAKLPSSKAGMFYISDGLFKEMNRVVGEEVGISTSTPGMTASYDALSGAGGTVVFQPEGISFKGVTAYDLSRMEASLGEGYADYIKDWSVEKQTYAFNVFSGIIPASAMLFYGGYLGDIGKVYESVYENAPEFRKEAADFEESSGLNVKADLLSWIGDSAGVAVLPDSTGFLSSYAPVGFVLMVETKDTQLARQKIDKIIKSVNTAGEMNIQTRKDELNGNAIYYFSDPATGTMGGYTFYKNFLVLGSSSQVLEAVLNEDVDSLSEDGAFNEALAGLPGDEAVSQYVSIQRILQTVSSSLEGPGRAIFDNEVLPYVKPFKGISASEKIAVAGDEAFVLSTVYVVLNHVKVVLNGTQLKFSVPPLIKNGRTLVAFRPVAEAMGADVGWDAETRTVTLSKNGRVSRITIGKSTAYIGNRAVKLDVPAEIINGSTMVPLRFIAESLGAGVSWEAETNTVRIN
ncbi:MAG: DUF3352 domain-containing protein [Bacillota bacterium]